MNLLTLYRELLLSQSNPPSPNTVKNYISDVRGLTQWFEKTFSRPMVASDFSQDVIHKFLSESDYSPKTRERQLASAKKLTSLFHASGILPMNPLPNVVHVAQTDIWKLKDFQHDLFKQNASPATIKNYLSDIAHFTKWIDAQYGIQKHISITNDIISAYQSALSSGVQLSPKSINRKLSTIRKYLDFTTRTGLTNTPQMKTEHPSQPQNIQVPELPITKQLPDTRSLASLDSFRIQEMTYSKIPPVRLLQKFGGMYGILEETAAYRLSSYIPTLPRIKAPQLSHWYPKLRHHRPAWYHRYHAWPMVKHFHVAALALFCTGIMLFAYAKYFDVSDTSDVLGLSHQNRRVLQYSGKLMTRANTPITRPTELTFSIYPHSTANNSVLWKEVHKINPNDDGSFSVQLGRQNALNDSFFAENKNLYLGMKVGGESEMLPRQRLANVGFASDSQLLDGMQPLTKNPAQTANTILALDSSGNLTFEGTANPVFQATGGDFTLSGTTTILTTVSGSNGNLIFNPDGSGVVDIRKPIVNDSQDASASGSVDFADEVSIATESAGAVLNIHNTGDTGSILSLMSRNVSRLTVENSGNVGIGTINPSQLVHLAHNSAPTLRIEHLTSGNTLDITTLDTLASIGTNGNFGLGFKTNSLMRMHITPNGNVGIGTSAPTALLDVNGSASIAGSLTFTGAVRNIQTSNNNNLIIGGNTTGNLIFQPLNGVGFVGISTNTPEYKLDLLDVQATRSAMRIYNASGSTDADGLNIQLGNNSGSVASTNHFVNFQTRGAGLVGAITGNGSNGVTYSTNGVADFAEYLRKDPNEQIAFGMLTCATTDELITACDSEHTALVGVASEQPAFLGGKNLGDASVPVGLVGQVDVLVSGKNGKIKSGDPITYSQVRGIGVRATNGGMIVGRALQDHSHNGIGKIRVLVQPTWYEPLMNFSSAGEIITTNIPDVTHDQAQFQKIASALTASTYSLRRENELVKNVGSYASVITSRVKTGLLEAQNAVFTGTVVAKNMVVEQLNVSSDNLFINGTPLSQYIASLIPADSAPTATASDQRSDFISPLSDTSQIGIALENSKFEILDENHASGAAVASIDNQGNARFNGTVEANNASISGTLEAQDGSFRDISTDSLVANGDASVAGRLTVDSIRAKTIEGIEETVSNIASKYIYRDQNQSSQPSEIAADNYIDVATMSAQFAMFHENLLSLGTTTLREATVMDSFSIGTQFVFGQESIDVLGQNLQIQPLRQGGVDFLGGLMALDSDGNLKVGGDARFAKNVTVTGGLFANILSPLPGSDLDIYLPNKNATETAQFRVINGSKTPVLTINDTGDVYSSGSAKFMGDLVASGSAFLSKINIFSQDAQALNENEMVASSSAGTAILKAYKREVTIKSPHVNAKSLIYITPSTNIGNQSLYLMRQTADGSFTVGLSDILQKDVQFNWIVVN